MSETSNIRFDRVKRLLEELRYEVARGMMENEIDETLFYRFYVPISKRVADGVVECEFRTRPIQRVMMGPDAIQPRLRLVKS